MKRRALLLLTVLLLVMQSVMFILPAAAATDGGMMERPLYDAPPAEELGASVDLPALRDYLSAALAEGERSVDLSAFNVPESEETKYALMYLVWRNIPEAFHVSGLSVYGDGSKQVVMNVSYDPTFANDYQRIRANCDAVAAKLVAGVKDSTLSQAEKALVIHDRLVVHCAYDYDNYLAGAIPDKSYCMVGPLLDGVGVCQGYALAYQYLLRLVGIESYYCSSDTLNHGWNIVKIDGKWYHVDCTWDDPVYDKKGRVYHTNFLLSSDGIYRAGSSGHKATDYDTTPTDTTYDIYYWQELKSQICLVNNKLYYISGKNLVYRQNDEETAVTSADYVWRTADGGWWSNNYSRLVSVGDCLYYLNDGALYEYDAALGVATKLYTPALAPGEGIGGFYLENDTIYMQVFESPNESTLLCTPSFALPSCEHPSTRMVEDVPPTCVATGVGHRVCNDCGKTAAVGITINATGEHVAADELVVDTAATCGKAGVGHSVCGTCGITMETGLAIPATGNHAWDNGVVTTEPTANTEGVKTFTCTLCGETKTEKIPTTGVNTLTIFKDLKKKDWYVKNGAIDFVYNNGLFSGLTSTEFGPNDNMTRGMFVTVLGRLHGVSVSKNVKTVFSDVAKGKFYTGYVKWANENDIVSGLTATTFGPDENVNREQICAMMVRYCNFANITLEKKNAAITFKDTAKISRFARSAVKACQQGGIVNGEKVTGGYNFRPQGNATRAEVATIMMNFAKAYK